MWKSYRGTGLTLAVCLLLSRVALQLWIRHFSVLAQLIPKLHLIEESVFCLFFSQMSGFDTSASSRTQLLMFILPNQPLAFPHGLLIRPLTPSPHQELRISAPVGGGASLVTFIICCNLNGIQLFPSKVHLLCKVQPKAPPSWFFFLIQTPSMECGYKFNKHFTRILTFIPPV